MVSVEAWNRSLADRVRLNRQILENKYWFLPVDNVGHENFAPVGRGVQTGEQCGRYVGLDVCKDVDAHKGVHVKGVDCTGKVVVRLRHWWCHKSGCPVCFIRGWAKREADNIVARLLEGEKRGFGKSEHVTVSVALADRGLSESVMRQRSWDALADRGFYGGSLLFHGFREDKARGVLVWSPHYHAFGFIKGGFDRCRECVHVRDACRSCDGFKGREVRGYARDGYLVKVHAERTTLFGTAWYQLHHATVRLGIKRFHVVTWWGACSYRKYASASLKAQAVCVACGGEMERAFHNGERCIVKDIGHEGYVPWFVDDEFDSSGLPNYVEIVRGGMSG